jgi:hypothetical protein
VCVHQHDPRAADEEHSEDAKLKRRDEDEHEEEAEDDEEDSDFEGGDADDSDDNDSDDSDSDDDDDDSDSDDDSDDDSDSGSSAASDDSDLVSVEVELTRSEETIETRSKRRRRDGPLLELPDDHPALEDERRARGSGSDGDSDYDDDDEDEDEDDGLPTSDPRSLCAMAAEELTSGHRPVAKVRRRRVIIGKVLLTRCTCPETAGDRPRGFRGNDRGGQRAQRHAVCMGDGHVRVRRARAHSGVCREETASQVTHRHVQSLIPKALELFDRASAAPSSASAECPSLGVCIGGRARAELLQVCVKLCQPSLF